MIHIVDDDEDVRASTSFLLRSHGYETEIYGGGREFLQSELEEGCVLLDLRMPGMSGLEVQEAMSSRNIELPVIVLSGHGDIAAAVQSLRLGAVDFLEKPYGEGELIGAIARASQAIAERHDREAVRLTAAARVGRLSASEKNVLQGLLAGLSEKAMARRFKLSLRAAGTQYAAMLETLGVATSPQAIRVGLDAGLPPLD